MNKTLYHNPRCSKSRQALALLHEHSVSFDIKLYLQDGIDADEVVELVKKLGLHPSEFVRKGEQVYRDLGTDEFSIEEWAAIIEEHPILLERPILVVGDQAVTNLYDLFLAEVEAPLLECVLRFTGNNQSQTAQILGMNRGTLRKKLLRYRLI